MRYDDVIRLYIDNDNNALDATQINLRMSGYEIQIHLYKDLESLPLGLIEENSSDYVMIGGLKGDCFSVADKIRQKNNDANIAIISSIDWILDRASHSGYTSLDRRKYEVQEKIISYFGGMKDGHQ
jgi:hypothetical protein